MKYRILFDLKQEYYFNCFISILKAMENDPRFEIAFYVGKNEERRWGIIPVYHKRRIEENLRQGGYTVAGSPGGFDAVVAGDALRHPHRYGSAAMFVSDHGPGIKTLRIRNIVRQRGWRYTVFVEGEYWMDTIRRFGHERDAEWIVIGAPKLDTLFWDGYYSREKILTDLGLDPSKRTVLFAPSYRPSCIPFLKTSVARIAERYNLIIKLHPYSWGGKYASARQSRIYSDLARRQPEIALIPKEDYDFHPYMFASDTVISDTSSALAICLALSRVGIVCDFPYPRMTHSDGTPIVAQDPGEYLGGIFVHLKDVPGLMGAVEDALNPSAEHMERLMSYRDYYFTGLDGKAGERAKQVILERIESQVRQNA
jgi:hypothetical protein